MRFAKNGKKYIFIIYSVLVCCLINAQFQHITFPHINNYTTKDYNGQPDNFAGIEDNRGLMFFGNLWGILEFDGTRWRNIYFPNGSSGTSFAKDEKGVIYCGGRGEFGFLTPDSSGLLKYSSLIYLLNANIDFSEIWSTYYIDSSIVFCSYEALFLLKNNSITIIKSSTALERTFFVDGKIYVNEKGRGLCYLNKNKLDLVQGGTFFANMTISAVLPLNGNRLLVAGNNSFYEVDKNSIKPWNNVQYNRLLDCKLFNALSINDSTYMLATNTKGLIIINDKGNIKNIFNKGNGLVSNDILSFFSDSNGNIWVLTKVGISKIELNGCFNYINEYHGISGLIYTTRIFNNSLYLGTSEGLYYQNLSVGKPVNNNFRLKASTQGNVWALQQFGEELFCGHNEGVFIINKQISYRIPETKGVWCFLQPKGIENILLAGTYNGLMILDKKDQIWRMRGYVKGFNESSRYLIQDKMEDFWVSHGNKGLFKLSLTHSFDSVLKIKPYSTQEGLSSTYNNTVYCHANDVIVTNNKGFYKYDYKNDRFRLWNKLNNVLGNFSSIQRFVVDSNQSFWVILNDEKIVHISKNNKDSFVNDLTIRKFHKLLAGSFEHILPFNNNNTLIATLEGIAIFDKEKYKKNIILNAKNFKAFIRKVELTRNSFLTVYAGERGNSKNPSEIKYKDNSLRFSFSSNCFEDIELTQYHFLLVGFDDSWSPWSTSFQKEYTNLPPGNYKFVVCAMNSYNILSKEDYFEFVVLPPWYKSNYAYFLYVILFLLAVYAGYKFITFRFMIQKRRLELKKERELLYLNKKHIEVQIKKENEILKLNNEKLSAEIANLEQQKLLRKKDEQLKEELDKSKQEQLLHEKEKHLLEITHKNKELSIMAMQIAHKSESIAKIREYLQSFTEKNNSADFKTLTMHLFQYLDRDIEHDKEWKEFQEYFDMVHSSFINKLKSTYPAISPSLLKLSTYLRVKMSNKQIARLMNTTVESVLKSRYRLREKLRLKPEENLDDFIEKF